MMSSDGLSSSPNYPIITNPNPSLSSNSAKRKRNLAGNPDAEVIALSPKSLMATNRFVCEICNKGFQREQNLQLHRRGHNLPWKLKQRNKNEIVRKKVYICPEKSCVHHDASRALGDLTGVKKHFSRKHGEKKWKCDKCSKKYAVQSDWKAHSKICGTREYKCDCGTLFSRKDSFITHRAFCDALSEENSRMASFPMIQATTNLDFHNSLMNTNGGGRITNQRFPGMYGGGGFGLAKSPEENGLKPRLPIWLHNHDQINNPQEIITSTPNSSFMGSSSSNNNNGGMLSSEMLQWLSRNHTELPQGLCLKEEEDNNNNNKGDMVHLNSLYNNYGGDYHAPPPPPDMSATALLQKATQIGSIKTSNSIGFGVMTASELGFGSLNQTENNNLSGRGMMNEDGLLNLTRDFLGVEGNMNDRRVFSLQQDLINFTSSMNDSSIGFSESQ